ncbi:MAG TPA: orotidine-5'-phosphate decarboxylase [Desulfohalobiaceae bacterium]|nr:orotidine-5'-phosphate decarboxylase [Desulfohalobiaceae bacterium]
MNQDKHFGDRLIRQIRHKKSFVIVGLDPQPQMMPDLLFSKSTRGQVVSCQDLSEAIWEFNQELITAIAPYVVAVKLQIAFYQCLGWQGLRIFAKTIEYSKQHGLLVVADAKCNDIGSTAEAYAHSFLGPVLSSALDSPSAFDADAVTVNPYLGRDGIEPFTLAADSQGKGIFVLVRTSNPFAGDIQDLTSPRGRVYQVVGRMVHEFGESKKGALGYTFVGAVVGATYPDEAMKLRKIMPDSFFLVPGYGAQGGSAKDVLPCFNPDGLGAVINASRSVIYAFKGSPWKEELSERDYALAASSAAKSMRDEINEAVAKGRTLPWS